MPPLVLLLCVSAAWAADPEPPSAPTHLTATSRSIVVEDWAELAVNLANKERAHALGALQSVVLEACEIWQAPPAQCDLIYQEVSSGRHVSLARLTGAQVNVLSDQRLQVQLTFEVDPMALRAALVGF